MYICEMTFSAFIEYFVLSLHIQKYHLSVIDLEKNLLGVAWQGLLSA